MGRCADVILANNHIPHISIFITAPFLNSVYTESWRSIIWIIKKAERLF